MITLNHLSYRYPSGMWALTDINAEIGPGLHLLVGENGSGKTTLLHIMAGLRTAVPADACMINNMPTAQRNPRLLEELFILTDEMMFPYRTINEMTRRHAIFYPSFSPQLLGDTLHRFGMTGNEPIDFFSLGNRKKAQLAYVIALRPKVLLLDEPLNGLDITARSEFIKILAENISEDQTVIISSHTVLDFRNLIDGLIVISGGQLILSMPTWKIAERIAFVNTSNPPTDAIFLQQSFGQFSSIIPNPGGELTTDIDLILFYNAIVSDARQSLLSHLNKQ
ncbi:MAG: ABC transporter ATP-binding protein [Barnesiella sp.]|nr:ABC transporter ATP-binding protein [Barnesiella sp.]